MGTGKHRLLSVGVMGGHGEQRGHWKARGELVGAVGRGMAPGGRGCVHLVSGSPALCDSSCSHPSLSEESGEIK